MAARPKRKPPRTKQTEAEIPTAFILAELKSVCASRQFARSARLREFLHFMVQKRLKGEIESLKEYAIGVDVFGKKETFDQRKDAIVRVQANRLRRKLKLYYATEGVSNLIRLTVPTGGFVPSFLQRGEVTTTRNSDSRLP
jgi:hypothetical protein